jgi:hypothetical protein
MNTRLITVLLPALLAPSLFAQDEPDMSPAKELAKFEPLIGNWAGTGKMVEPGGAATNWTAQGTYQWCLNKHFVQEDFVIRFEGMSVPMTFRNYLGWDREGGRYVSVLASNEGVVRLSGITFLPDGTMMQMMTHQQDGVPYVERSRTKVDGEALSLVIDVLMADGQSLQMIDSKLTRSDKAFECDWGEEAWMGATPNEDMKRLRVIRGQYEVKGEMVMAPETPEMKITGTDQFLMIWDGTVMHAKTLGFAEGSPDAYESHAFWAWDKQRKCMRTVFVDNMGQLGEMECRWVGDDLVSTGMSTMGGVPTTQRFVMSLGRKGELKSGVGHTCFGGMEPFVSFRASYQR